MISATEKALLGPMERIARAMSRRWDVRIEPTGGACCTDGQVISIPFRSDELPADARRILHGMLDHEVSHVAEEREHEKAGRRTPMSLLSECRSNRLKYMFNVFEDLRIERKYSERYPGMADNLRALNEHAFALRAEKGPAPDPWTEFGLAILEVAMGRPSLGLEPNTTAALKLIADEIAAIPGMCWAEDALCLAERVVAKLSEEAESESSSEAGKDGADTGTQGEGQSRTSGQPRASSDGSVKEGDSVAGARRLISANATDSDPASSLRRYLEARIENLPDEPTGRYRAHPAAKARDRWISLDSHGSVGWDYGAAKRQVFRQIGALKAKLLVVLRSRALAYDTAGHRTGTLDSSRLARVATGDRALFTQCVEGETLDVAVSILVDQSGSMSYGRGLSRIESARRMSIALCETLDSLKIPFELIGYSNWLPEGRVLRTLEWGRTSSFRWCGYHLFGESYRHTRSRLAWMEAGGDNADSEAVWETAARLASRPESRKILLVLSDGRPSVGGNYRLQVQHLHEVIQRVSKAGIEILGIGCEDDSVSQYYCEKNGSDHIVVDDIDQLAIRVFRLLRTRLLK